MPLFVTTKVPRLLSGMRSDGSWKVSESEQPPWRKPSSLLSVSQVSLFDHIDSRWWSRNERERRSLEEKRERKLEREKERGGGRLRRWKWNQCDGFNRYAIRIRDGRGGWIKNCTEFLVRMAGVPTCYSCDSVLADGRQKRGGKEEERLMFWSRMDFTHRTS